MANNNNMLLEVKDLKQYFPIQKGFLRRTVGYIKAVNGVSLTIKKNETLGLVGESGCGKTTLGRSILRLYEPTDGKILFNNGDEMISILDLDRKEQQKMRCNMQMIFQDPFSSLNERMTVMQNVGEPLLVNGIASGKELEERVEDMLVKVGLRKEHLRRYPHAFSGGQRQRIGIARALVVNPKFVVADEPVSALDVSIQAQILNLLKRLQDEFQLSYLFISHDLSVIRHVSNRIAVMYVGRLVELGARDQVLNTPLHPYTEALLSAVPRAGKKGQRASRIIMSGDPPDPSRLPSGCSFHERCRYTEEICKAEEPEFTEIETGHYVACHRARELSLKGV